MKHVLIFQILATYFMTGIIWFVQIVHYPLIQIIPDQARAKYARKHANLISWVVIPAMLVELSTGTLLVLNDPKNHLWQLGLALLIGIWLITFSVLVPLHKNLGKDGAILWAEKLVHSNWPRTLLWSIRAGVLYLALKDF